jgi:hypothetical protein
MSDDSPFLALLGYAYLGAVMIGSYFVATLVDQEWFCFVWLSLLVVTLIASMGVFTLVLRWFR